MDKKSLGAFYTTKAKEVLDIVFNSFVEYYNNGLIIEPCCGNGDLINFLNENKLFNTKQYDINNTSYKDLIVQDTIIEPIDLNNNWIITNPPYLAKNKMSKELKEKYNKYLIDCTDIYEIYIKQIIKSECLGGILILPINFLFSFNNKLRKDFICKYEIKTLKIYEKQIFNDTTSSVIVFDFQIRNQRNNNLNNFKINTVLLQKHKTENFIIELSKENDFTYGNEIYNRKYDSDLKFSRYINKDLNGYYLTNIEIFCIDSRNKQIEAFYNENPEINKISDRSKINITTNKKFVIKYQKIIIEKFNEKLNKYRKNFHSLFMTSYREFDRKRISFDLIYILLENITNKLYLKHKI